MANPAFPRHILLKELPQDLQNLIAETAREAGVSPDEAVVLLLKSRIGSEARPSGAEEFHDLDELFGVWTREEAADFNDWLSARRSIDPEMWR